MNIAVAVKVVPDDQDITVAPDRSLDSSKAHQIASEYDLNAIEAAAQLAEAEGARLVAISASNAKAGDMKVRKSILSRGPEELLMIADDAYAFADSRTTAKALAKLVGDVEGGVDLVVCGDGSADMYAGQVNVQLASVLGVPCINSVTAMRMENGGRHARMRLPAHRRHARDSCRRQEACDGQRRSCGRRGHERHRGDRQRCRS